MMRLAGFHVAALDRINGLGKRTAGFQRMMDGPSAPETKNTCARIGGRAICAGPVGPAKRGDAAGVGMEHGASAVL